MPRDRRRRGEHRLDRGHGGLLRAGKYSGAVAPIGVSNWRRCPGSQVIERETRGHRDLIFEDVSSRVCCGILVLQEQPLVPVLHPDERVRALELLPAEGDANLPLGDAFAQFRLGKRTVSERRRDFLIRGKRSGVPDEARPRAVLSLRDDPLERRVVQRVVLSLRGEALLTDRCRRPPGDGPALQHPVQLEAEVVVQTRCGMLVDDEPEWAGGRGG